MRCITPPSGGEWLYTALLVPPDESFTGVIGRAGLDQGRGVLSRVTSASMLQVEQNATVWRASPPNSTARARGGLRHAPGSSRHCRHERLVIFLCCDRHSATENDRLCGKGTGDPGSGSRKETPAKGLESVEPPRSRASFSNACKPVVNELAKCVLRCRTQVSAGEEEGHVEAREGCGQAC